MKSPKDIAKGAVGAKTRKFASILGGLAVLAGVLVLIVLIGNGAGTSTGEGAAALIIGGILMLLSSAMLYFRLTGTQLTEAPPKTWLDDPDDWRWQAAAEDVPHESLAGVREVAKNWAASISALLGIAGTAAIVKGPEAFSDIEGDAAWFVLVLSLFAVVLAGLSVLLASLAAQGTPRKLDHLDGWTLKEFLRGRGRTAVRQLILSRILGADAALAVLVALAISWFAALDQRNDAKAQRAKAKPQKAIVVPARGKAVCGPLKFGPNGEGELRVPKLELVEQIKLVKTCPK